MIAMHRIMGKLAPAAAAIAALTLLAASDAMAAKPIKLDLSEHLSNGLEFPESVAIGTKGDIYVADRGNERVQELTPSGEFVSMFGREVNETTKGDICTAEEVGKGAKCKAGVSGAGPGEFHSVASLTVDPGTGDVYVQDLQNWRVQKFTPSGEFILMIGREVNETTKGNLCTAEEISKSGVKCQAGKQAQASSTEHGAFKFVQFRGDLLAVGPGPGHVLYVGDEQRFQEFAANGTWQREVRLTPAEPNSWVTALAVDRATGEIYLSYSINLGGTNVVRVFDAEGNETRSFQVPPSSAGDHVNVDAMTLDEEGHLAVTAFEEGQAAGPFGAVFNAATGHLFTRFALAQTSSGIAFGTGSEASLYAVLGNEIAVYVPHPVAELRPGTALCEPGPEIETSKTFNCILSGEVNPEEVSETEAWFEWGRTTDLGEVTPRQPVEEIKTITAPIQGARPNESFYFRLAAVDHNSPTEAVTSETASFTTPTALPSITMQPRAAFVGSFSAVMLGQLNPENAGTRYKFEYGPCATVAQCPEASFPLATSTSESSGYGKVNVTLEATGLQPGTPYHYRLVANNEHQVAGKAEGGQAAVEPLDEGTFTTLKAPVPEAASGVATQVDANSAVLSGTVNPDGQPATYTFEIGVYAGASTRYGIVFSGFAGEGTVPASKSLLVTGLQPGTTYAYRIKIASGYGTAEGEAVEFTTTGLPEVIPVPASARMLGKSAIAFPKAAVSKHSPKCKARQKHRKRRKCVKSKVRPRHKRKGDKAGKS
jgi:hypothetical protein